MRRFCLRMKGYTKLLIGLAVIAAGGSTAVAQRRLAGRGLETAKTLRTAIPASQLNRKVLRQPAQVWTGVRLADGTDPLRNSVFCGRAEKGIDAFSGGVFETVYNGQKEIYGFIATHTLSQDPYMLHRFFLLEMMDKQGRWRRIPAEVVQVSSVMTLDIALVKFLPEHEVLFTPLVISGQPPQVGEAVQSQGFSQYVEGYIKQRRVLKLSPFSFCSEMPWPRSPRNGFCGGAVVNAQHELVGVHTGSAKGPAGQEDIGYATHARFLPLLVEAYHRGGEVFLPILLDGKKVMDLQLAEGIDCMQIYDDRGNKIASSVFEYKFSFSKAEKLLRTEGARYAVFSMHRLAWSKQKPDFLEETPSYRHVIYDIREGYPVPTLPFAIKPLVCRL